MPESLMHLPTVYGSKAKIGVIVPPTNTANEAEWSMMAPADVSIHSARMPLHTDTTSTAGLAALYRDIEHYAKDLSRASVDAIVYGCTAGSMVSPVNSVADFMHEKTGIPSLTAAQAIVDALTKLSVQKLSVATPYHEVMNQHEKRFLQDHGIEVVAIEGLGYGENGVEEFRNIARVSADTAVDLVRSVDSDKAQAILISCTDLASATLITPLEQELGKPVISSNTATLWRALRLAGVDETISGFGTLFQR